MLEFIIFYIYFFSEILLVLCVLFFLLYVFCEYICSYLLSRLLFMVGVEVLIFQIFFLSLQSNSLYYNLLYYYSNFVLLNGHVILSYDSIHWKFVVSLLIFFCIVCTYVVFDLDSLMFYEYFVFLFLFLLGAFFVLVSTDLFFMYISIEMLSVTLYLLVVGNSWSVVAGEGGFNYFLLGSIGSVFFLFGISVFYGFFGTLNFFEILDLFLCEVSAGSVELGLKFSFIFLVSFIFFKLMVIPFHSWGPDVYDGTFTFVVLFLATVPNVIFLLLFLKFYFLFFVCFSVSWSKALLWFMLVSLVFSVFMTYFQVNLKSLFAYSAISHVSYVLLGLITYTVEGIFVVMFYFFNYLILVYSIFLFLLFFSSYYGGFTDDVLFLEMSHVSEFFFFFNANPMLVLGVSLILFSVGGIPPLAGFFSNLFIFLCLLNFCNFVVLLISVLVSVVSCIYYISLVQVMLGFWFLDADGWIFFDMNLFSCYFLVCTYVYNFFFLYFFDLILLLFHTIVLNFVCSLDFLLLV